MTTFPPKSWNPNLFVLILINYGTLKLLTHFTQKGCNKLPFTMKLDGFHFVSLDFSLSFSPSPTFPLLFPSFSLSFPFLCPPLSASPALLFFLHYPPPPPTTSISSSVSLRLHTPSLINSASTMGQWLPAQLFVLERPVPSS